MPDLDISHPPDSSWLPPLAIRFCLLLLVMAAELLGISVNFDNEVFSTEKGGRMSDDPACQSW